MKTLKHQENLIKQQNKEENIIIHFSILILHVNDNTTHENINTINTINTTH